MTQMENFWKRLLTCLEKQVNHFIPQPGKVTYSAFRGHHEFFSNLLNVPHWASHDLCWECDCQNFVGCDAWKSMKELDLEKPGYQVYTHAEHLADPGSEHALFQLPHVSARRPHAYFVLQRCLQTPYWWHLAVCLLVRRAWKGLQRKASQKAGRFLKTPTKSTGRRAWPIG